MTYKNYALPILLLVLFFFTQTTNAMSYRDLVNNKNPAGLSSLRLNHVLGYDEVTVFDRRTLQMAPREIRKLYGQMNAVLSKIASTFYQDFQSMFADGIEMTITTNKLGPFNSSDAAIGEFAHWKPSDGLSSSVIFAHEIGHALDSEPTQFGLPEVLKDLSTFFTFSEFFPDWVAYKANGTLNFKPKGLPSLIYRGYDLISYDLPSSYFSMLRSMRDLNQYLLQIKEKTKQTPQEFQFSKSLGISIEELKQKIEKANKELENSPSLESLENIRELDSHQLGMPIFLLLVDLEKYLGRSVNKEFLAALHSLDKLTSTDQTFYAFLEGYELSKSDYILIVVKTPRHFLSQFKEQFVDPQERAFLDSLYTSRKIDKGLLLEEKAIMTNHVRLRARQLIQERFRSHEKNGIGIYNPQNPFLTKTMEFQEKLRSSYRRFNGGEGGGIAVAPF